MIFRRSLYVLVLLVFFSLTNCDEKSNSQDIGVILGKDSIDISLISTIPEFRFYYSKMIESLNSHIPVMLLPLNECQDSQHMEAQKIAIQDSGFIRDVYDSNTGSPLRNEIMNIREALPADVPSNLETINTLYRVSMYHYFNNRTTVSLVDVKDQKVVHVDRPLGGQPEINKRLTDLAIQIAIHSPEVISILGVQPNEMEPVMPNVKTALNGTKCERSKHLCVAPTFINHENNRALWTIVDLTDWRLVGLRWTDLGESGEISKETERSLQNDYIMDNYCEVDNTLDYKDWIIRYRLTGSDGLEIFDVEYYDETIIRSAKVVDWHVGYSENEGFGYSDAMGCPLFSSSAVVAFNGPYTEYIIKEGKNVGVALIQDFRSPAWPVPCNYRYQNRYEFYDDGKFRIMAINLGRGCGKDGVYRPIMRIDLKSKSNSQFVEMWSGNKWEKWKKEEWVLQDGRMPFSNEGYQFKIRNDEGMGYYLHPGSQSTANDIKKDNAYTYISLRHPDTEGDIDLLTLGSCCNVDYRQGPELFLEDDEDIWGKDIVIWYVPQMKNDDTPGNEYCWANTIVENGVSKIKVWPGICGPTFIPISQK